MTTSLAPDICVIGAGTGGLSAALAAAGQGVSVVLIERDMTGGAAGRTAGLAAQALIAAARRARLLAEAPAFGVIVSRPKVDFLQVNEHVQAAVAAAAPNTTVQRLAALGIWVIAGEARFTDRRTVAIGDDYTVRARRFVIATGASPALPAIPGIDEVPVLTGEALSELRVCPKHLIVLGATGEGLALAQAFRRLGADVTLIDAGTPLPGEDRECVEVVLEQLAEEGVRILTGITVERIARARTRIQVVLDGETIEASHLLVADGRKPNIAGLRLDAAGIRYEPLGILTDSNMRTSNRSIYAIGDVTRAAKSAHLAEHHAQCVVRHALRQAPMRIDEMAIPRVVFTDPELAHVGLTEEQARGRRNDLRILRTPFAETDRARAERLDTGHIKVVATTGGRVLGVTIVGSGAAELIAPWSLALSRKLPLEALAGMVVPYGTLSEAGRRAALAETAARLTRPLLRRIIGRLRRLG